MFLKRLLVLAIITLLALITLCISALSVGTLKVHALEVGVTTEVTHNTLVAPSINEPNEVEVVHRIDAIDVYKLAPHAYLLRHGHMFSLEGYEHIFKTKERLRDLMPSILKAAKVHAIAPELIAAVIMVESSAVANAVSSKGAQGLMQLMPETQKELKVIDPFNKDENIDAGSFYLKQQLINFASVEEALAAYNAGPGNVKRYDGIPPYKETNEFVRKVTSTYEALKLDAGFQKLKWNTQIHY